MSASKTLTSTVAAAALVGAIGFAYAQSSSEGSPSAQPATPMESQSTTPSADTATTPSATDSSTTPSAPAVDSAPLTEQAPQADRN